MINYVLYCIILTCTKKGKPTGIAALTTGIGAGSDYLEGKLSDSSNSVIQELSDNVSQTSGKKIVSSNY